MAKNTNILLDVMKEIEKNFNDIATVYVNDKYYLWSDMIKHVEDNDKLGNIFQKNLYETLLCYMMKFNYEDKDNYRKFLEQKDNELEMYGSVEQLKGNKWQSLEKKTLKK